LFWHLAFRLAFEVSLCFSGSNGYFRPYIQENNACMSGFTQSVAAGKIHLNAIVRKLIYQIPF